MIQCAKCGSDTRSSTLITAMGEVMVAGTIGSDPQPVSAQVCPTCGYIELYAPQSIGQTSAAVSVPEEALLPEMNGTMPVPAL